MACLGGAKLFSPAVKKLPTSPGLLVPLPSRAVPLPSLRASKAVCTHPSGAAGAELAQIPVEAAILTHSLFLVLLPSIPFSKSSLGGCRWQRGGKVGSDSAVLEMEVAAACSSSLGGFFGMVWDLELRVFHSMAPGDGGERQPKRLE